MGGLWGGVKESIFIGRIEGGRGIRRFLILIKGKGQDRCQVKNKFLWLWWGECSFIVQFGYFSPGGQEKALWGGVMVLFSARSRGR